MSAAKFQASSINTSADLPVHTPQDKRRAEDHLRGDMRVDMHMGLSAEGQIEVRLGHYSDQVAAEVKQTLAGIGITNVNVVQKKSADAKPSNVPPVTAPLPAATPTATMNTIGTVEIDAVDPVQARTS